MPRHILCLSLAGMLVLLLMASPPAAAQQGETSGEQKTVNMDFDQVDLKVFIKFISNLTGKNFVVDDKVRGKVTILSPSPLTVDEAYKVFQSVLEVNGYTTVPSGDVIKIVRTVESRQKSMEVSTDYEYEPKPEDQVVTQIIPLEHASSGELRKILVPMVSKEGLLVNYDPTETLILIDYESNVQRIMKIVNKLDVKSFTGTVSVVQLEHASAETLTQKLSQLLGGQKKQAMQAGEMSFVPDERTNSVIVLANEQNTLRIKRILGQLDQPTPEDLSNIQVVPLENAKAEDLAQVLSNLAGKGGSEKGAQAISRDVSIVADKPSNSLVVIAQPKEFQNIMPIIEKLDGPRKQVFVEAAIIEISSDTSSNLGINWQAGTDFGGSDVDGVLFGTSSGSVGSSVEDVQGRLGGSGLSLGVLSFPFTYRGEEFFSLGGFISASQQDNNVHIISTPQLMTMENEEATVTIAENRPFVTSREVSGDTDREFNNIEYKDVGVTLKVTPLINNKGWIKMGLYQEVSRIDPNVEFDTETPITRKRTAETTVAVKDGQTVVIAGLMENKKSDNKSQVPGLGDVPLFGRLFQTTSQEERKTNLMVFITPRIVQDSADARKIAYNKSKLLNKLRFDIDGQVQPILEDFIHYEPMR